MKILIVNSFYYPDEVGGAERSVKFLAEELVRKGNEVAILTTGGVSERCVENGVRVFRIKAKNLGDYFSGAVRKPLWHLNDTANPFVTSVVAEVVRHFCPDVVHTNNLSGFSSLILGTIKGFGLPIVHTLRDYYLICPNTALFKNGAPCKTSRCLSCRVLSIPRLKATAHVDVVVGNSKFILDKHLEFSAFPNASIKTWIYNGYRSDEPSFSRMAPERSAPFTIGYIGRIARTKGVENLISSFNRLKDLCVDRTLRLVVAGTGDAEYLNYLSANVKDDSVEFIGVVPQNVFFRMVDLVVVPSLWDEPLSRVIFESFAHGVPLVSSNTGGSPELVVDHETGWLFDPHVDGSLIDVLLNVVSNEAEYQRISSNVIEWARHFTPECVLEQYFSVYEKAISLCA